MKFDDFQIKAMRYIDQGKSVIVSAPTGAGKTVIAEHVIKQCLDRQEKIIYTSPIKALSNQKYRDFAQDYSGKVGIITGDVCINTNAPALIMTTEIFRNKLLEKNSNIHEYQWIIFDEIHYIDDSQRGSVWEESLIFLPDHMKLLGLSATIPNINELVKWLSSIHKQKFHIVIEHERPVPLHFYFQGQNQVYNDITQLTKHAYNIINKETLHRSKWAPSADLIIQNTLPSLIEDLIEKDRLPCIYFVFSRKKSEFLATEALTFNFLNSVEKQKILSLYNALCDKFDITHEPSTKDMVPLLEKGIAYHHAGMLPTLKEVIERIFSTRLIKMIFTTETFALGINMPARTVVFDELRKYYHKGFRPLRVRDFYQMAGRAGRRSIDVEGFVYCRVNPLYISPDEIYSMIHGKPEKIKSRFNTAYATILNLYNQYQDHLYDVYTRSLHHYQVQKFARKRAVKTMESKVNLLKSFNHIKKGKLTEKGKFASKVYGYELILAELYDQNLLDKLSVKDLAILSVAIVYEPRKGRTQPVLSPHIREMKELTDDMIKAIHWIEKKFHIRPVSKRCAYHLTACMEQWMNGKTFQQILEYTDADEGEVVRYFRMSIQILREMKETDITLKLQEKIDKAMDKINRDVIDAEKQLRV